MHLIASRVFRDLTHAFLILTPLPTMLPPRVITQMATDSRISRYDPHTFAGLEACATGSGENTMRNRVVSFAVTLLMAAAAAVWSQDTRGTISGRVEIGRGHVGTPV